MTIEFCHKALAETHDFVIALACWIKVASAFASAHWERGEGVFESLLESEEFHRVEVDILLETQSALVWTYGVVELDAVAAIYMINAFVINPRNAEDDLSVRFHHALKNDIFSEFSFVLLDRRRKRSENFFHSLHKLWLPRIFEFGLLDDLLNIRHFCPLFAENCNCFSC